MGVHPNIELRRPTNAAAIPHPEERFQESAIHAMPAIFLYREFALADGLMIYGRPPSRPLYRTHSQRRETARSAGAAIGDDRTDHQPQASPLMHMVDGTQIEIDGGQEKALMDRVRDRK
jgi:hypothetical protein